MSRRVATGLETEYQARFESIANTTPPLSRDQIATQLAQEPKVDPKTYYRWFAVRELHNEMDRAAADPVDFKKVLTDTRYDDPDSLSSLINDLNGPVESAAPIAIGNVKRANGEQASLFLNPQPGLLPRDFDNWPGRGDPGIEQTVQIPPENAIKFPEFYAQIGAVLVTSGSSKPDPDAADSRWVLAVAAADRQVYAIFNPLGNSGAESVFDSDYGKRPVADVFPGTSKAATAVPFGETIDDVMKKGDEPRKIDESKLLILPDNVKIQFGGVNEEGWSKLKSIGRFANVPQYPILTQAPTPQA